MFRPCPALSSRCIITVVIVACVVVSAERGARAADPLRDATSLKWIPADVAVYGSWLRVREQYEAVAGSRAMKRLLEMPILKMGLTQLQVLQLQPLPGGATLKDILSQPENKELIDLLIDAHSSEIFCAGGPGQGEFLAAFNELNMAMNAARIETITEGDRSPEANVRRMVKAVSQAVEKLKVPATLVGYKLTNTQRAEAQIARLEKVLSGVLTNQSKLRERLSRETIGGVSFLTLKLDGTLVPWDQIPRDDFPGDKQELEKIVEKAKTLKLTISLGVRDGYLLLSTGEDNSYLQSLGKGPLLIDRPEMAPLKKFADKPLTSIRYVSQEYQQQASNVPSQIDSFVKLAEQVLPQAELSQKLQKELAAGVKTAGEEIKKTSAAGAAVSSFGFRTSRGIESYSYHWTTEGMLDASKPLSILNHVGGDPLAFIAARDKPLSPDDYNELVGVLKKAFSFAEQIAAEKLPAEQKPTYDKLRADLMPLVERLDKTMRLVWIPAFKDGQKALVIDAKLTSNQWQSQMPRSERPLPMLEMGIVSSVSDAGLVKQGASEFFAVANEAIAKVRTALPGVIPEFKLQPPATRDFPEGSVYYYLLPSPWGLDSQVAPNAGLSNDTLALSMLPKFTLRLLKTTPPQTAGPLADRTRPLAAAGYCNWAGLCDAISPWIDYGLDRAAEENDFPAKSVKDQVRIGLDFLKSLRTVSSATYVDGEATVTHSEFHLADAP